MNLIKGRKKLSLINNEEIRHDYLRKNLDIWHYLYINNNIVGIIVHKHFYNTVVLKLIYILPTYRGRGYGKIIYKLFEMSLRKQIKKDTKIILHDISGYDYYYMKLGFSKSYDKKDKKFIEKEENTKINDNNFYYKELVY